MSSPVAFAVAAHPDDIEFLMAGTLLLLKEAGYETHYMTISSGSCGSLSYPADEIRKIRKKESEEAAKILGAHYHPSIGDDLEIFYDIQTLRQLSATMREVEPNILLVPSPQDYMEDHTNSCRLAVTAAFTRGMPNFETVPPRTPLTDSQVTVYHALPHGLRDSLRRRIFPGVFIDTSTVHDTKIKALAAHQSQQEWLDKSQNMNAYLKTSEEFSREIAKMSGAFEHAEGWRRHIHYGFCEEDSDPLREALKDKWKLNEQYEAELEGNHG